VTERARWWRLKAEIEEAARSRPEDVPELVREANAIFDRADLSHGSPPICRFEWDGESLSYGPDHIPR